MNTALEYRICRGREKGHIPVNTFKAHTVCQCGAVLPKRYTLPANTESRANILGETLASAGDDGNILLWVPTDIPTTAFGEDHAEEKESWRIKHMIRTNSGAEIYDLAWSPDGQYFITGGMDNTARIFNAHTGTSNMKNW